MPQLRVGVEELAARHQNHWPTGIPQLDQSLNGGLPRGALSEVISPKRSSGSALLRDALLARAAAEKQIVAFIDGRDSLDVTAMEETTLERLLWVRSRSAEESLKAADIILRDRNLTLVILDLMLNSPAELRRIPATTWFRFQRILEQGTTVCMVLTPYPKVAPAQARITISSSVRTLADLNAGAEPLLSDLKLEVSDARHLQETNRQMLGTA